MGNVKIYIGGQDEREMVRTVFNAYRDSMSGLAREVWVLCAALFINRCGSMVLTFLTLYLTNKLGFSVATAGLIFSVYGMGAICGAYVSGRLVDAVGAVRIQIVCLFIAAPLYLLIPMFESFTGIAAVVFTLSFFNEAVRPASATAVSRLASEKNTTRAFGLQRLAVNLGFSFGPAIGGVLAEIDYWWLFVADGVTTALGAALLLSYFGFKRHAHVEPAVENEDCLCPDTIEQARQQSPLKDRTFLCFLGLILLSAIVFFQFHATYPKYLEERYLLTPRWIGAIFAVNTVIIVLLEMLLLRWVGNRSALKTIGWGCLLSCLGFGLLPAGVLLGGMFGNSFGFLVVTMIVLTFGEMLSMPISSGFVATRSRSRSSRGKNRGMYMSWYTMTYSLAAILAPAIGGTIYQFNKESVWYLSTVVGVLLLAGFYRLNTHAMEGKRTLDRNRPAVAN